MLLLANESRLVQNQSLTLGGEELARISPASESEYLQATSSDQVAKTAILLKRLDWHNNARDGGDQLI